MAVLLSKVLEDLLRADAERRQPDVTELYKDPFLLRTIDVHLADIGNTQQIGAESLSQLLQLLVVRSRAGDRIEN